ncbi:MAG: hypothetical protein LBQ52_03875 [Helicobacteraceae bacterium]|jgi:ABC-type Fe3+-citrate transport system substrate-binding protein|nr:hypothetical protein [Helicobacteraceae bacterium]
MKKLTQSLALVCAVLAFASCASKESQEPNAGKEITDSAGNTAVDSTKGNVNEAVRDGVDKLFDRLLKK